MTRLHAVYSNGNGVDAVVIQKTFNFPQNTGGCATHIQIYIHARLQFPDENHGCCRFLHLPHTPICSKVSRMVQRQSIKTSQRVPWRGSCVFLHEWVLRLKIGKEWICRSTGREFSLLAIVASPVHLNLDLWTTFQPTMVVCISHDLRGGVLFHGAW